jgi:Fe-S-cluster containining protein
MPNWVTGDSNIELSQVSTPGKTRVKISGKSLRQKFQKCEKEYIQENCHGRCCEGSNGLMVTVHESEKEKFSELCDLDGNFIADTDGTGVCPFKKEHLCTIHTEKPFGCKASPFTFNKNDTLIIRNRYRLLKCYNTPDAVPAYEAHRWSLEQIFGKENTEGIIDEIKAGNDDIYATIDPDIFKIIKDNDFYKHGNRSSSSEFDMLFTCPPYADLEVYSDKEGDISNMEYAEFRSAYFEIIKKACSRIAENSFAVIVIGEVRDGDGNYYNFLGDTISAFVEAGMNYYNEIVLATMIGTLPIRAGRPFEQSRKIGKTHQNILVFCKGDARAAAEKIGSVHMGELVANE